MTIFSAIEDLIGRTLAAIPGWFGKLQYLAALRTPQGRYSHWGLNRVHGEDEMQKAASEAHRHVISQVLQTPLRDLEADLERHGRYHGSDSEEFLQDLQAKGPALLPEKPGAGAARHLSSTLLALVTLARAKRAATRRAS